jgi:hypothetical protein
MRFLIVFLLLFCIKVKAQSSAQNEARLKGLISQKIEFNKLTDGEYDGYRVKIHFGSDRESAQAVKSTFLDLYTDVPVYEKYIQPNFTILVGDFRTKLEAYAFMKTVQGDFPSAFIVKDKIKPINLKEEISNTRAD